MLINNCCKSSSEALNFHPFFQLRGTFQFLVNKLFFLMLIAREVSIQSQIYPIFYIYKRVQKGHNDGKSSCFQLSTFSHVSKIIFCIKIHQTIFFLSCFSKFEELRNIPDIIDHSRKILSTLYLLQKYLFIFLLDYQLFYLNRPFLCSSLIIFSRSLMQKLKTIPN